MERSLVKIMACPSCKGQLRHEEDCLICKICKKSFMIQDDIPILLP